MTEPTHQRARPDPERREKVAVILCRHFAAGHIDLDELERRLGVTDRARTEAELETLTRDLPALEPLGESETPDPALPVPDRPRTGWAIALMGGGSRKGRWTPPRRLHTLVVMGGVKLDFREAHLAPGLTDVVALAVMGGVEIIVPPELPVEVRGVGLMGAVDSVEHTADELDPRVPRLRVSGLACMGGIEVKTREVE